MPPISGIAALTDDCPPWQPGPLESRGFGLGIHYDYRAPKLRDPQVRAAVSPLTNNPFFLVARVWLDLQAAGSRQEDVASAIRAALLSLREGRYRDDHLAAILAFVEQATTLPLARYRAFVDEVIQTEGATMAQVLSYIKRKGWRRGREEGREEGRLDVLLRLLSRAVGPLDEPTTSRIQTLGAAALPDLAGATLAFSSQADLERWLTDRGV